MMYFYVLERKDKICETCFQYDTPEKLLHHYGNYFILTFTIEYLLLACCPLVQNVFI